MKAKTFIAECDIESHSFVKFGTAEGAVTLATSTTDVVIGVTADVDVSEGNVVDVYTYGFNKVCFGETVAQGDLITVDESGYAIKATDGDNVIGIALETSNEGEYGSFVFRTAEVAKSESEEPEQEGEKPDQENNGKENE